MTISQDRDKIIRKHFKKRRLLKFSAEMSTVDSLESTELFENDWTCTLIQIEGVVLEVISINESSQELFKEIMIMDKESKIIIPVIEICAKDGKTQTEIQCDQMVMCVGTIHYNWRPDLRAEISYPLALKSFLIKLQ